MAFLPHPQILTKISRWNHNCHIFGMLHFMGASLVTIAAHFRITFGKYRPSLTYTVVHASPSREHIPEPEAQHEVTLDV